MYNSLISHLPMGGIGKKFDVAINDDSADVNSKDDAHMKHCIGSHMLTTS
jgi:hypothetical protein